MRILPKVCFCVISVLHPNVCFFLFEYRLFQFLFKRISRIVLRNHLTFKISLEVAFSYSKVAGKTMYKGLCVSGNQELYGIQRATSTSSQVEIRNYHCYLKSTRLIIYLLESSLWTFLLGSENASIHKLSGKQDKEDAKPSGRQFADRIRAHWRKGLPSYFTWSCQVNHLHILEKQAASGSHLVCLWAWLKILCSNGKKGKNVGKTPKVKELILYRREMKLWTLWDATA